MNRQPTISLPPFLDAKLLLEASRPPMRINWFWYGIALLGALVTMSLMSLSQPESRKPLQVFSGVLISGALVAGAVGSAVMVRRHRVELQTVEAIEEMLQLRRWEPAAILLNSFLSQPVRSPRNWARALVQLSGLMVRYHRFEDAIMVQSFLIEHEILDDSADYVVRLGRAIAMLREDHLVDADRAIGDLRRRVPPQQSGGFSLIEIYRDVKTGHAQEAIDLFAERLTVMQQQLGHRVADAHALVARAYDMLGREEQAAAAYQRATLLAPPSELQRRYPEVTKLTEKYPAAIAPREAA